MKISDIAALIDIPEEKLRQDISTQSHPASIAYRKAKARAVLQLRKTEKDLAAMGSASAIEGSHRALQDMTADEL